MFKGSKYANVTSTMALIVALGGTGAYAANTIGSSDIKNNAIRSADIKNKEIKNADLANNAVTGGKVKAGTLDASDFKAGQLPAGAKGATGATGPAGPKGDKGDAGPAILAASGAAANSTSVGLAGGAAPVASAQITTTASSRIIATGTAEVQGNGGNDDRVYCYLRDGSGDLGQRMSADVPDTGSDQAVIASTGAAVRPAGTYTVELACGINGGTVTYNEGAVTVVAAAP